MDDANKNAATERVIPLVGIGLGTGGVPALQRLLQGAPRNWPFGALVVSVSSTVANDLAAAVRAASPFPVVVCEAERVPLEAGHVYLLPPDRRTAISGGVLTVGPVAQSPHLAVDLLFRQIAAVGTEDRAVVVLSGEGNAGAQGLGLVKEAGGFTFAQAPDDAAKDDMPRAAIQTGDVDWVLPAAQIATRLAAIGTGVAPDLPADDEADASGRSAAAPPEIALRDILSVLYRRTGHDFADYKRPTVIRRLHRRMQVRGATEFSAYLALLKSDPDESKLLLRDLLIGVTNFFRDAPAFDALKMHVIEPLFASGPPGQLRVWVPGCSTGEEAYSIAMLLSERAALLPSPPKISIFGTDIDEAALAKARTAKYPAAIEADVEATRLRRWFEKDALEYRIRKEVRERVMFALHNLLRDPPFSRLDFISCRNLLIYLDRGMHAHVLEMFHFALRPGGYLFLGTSESAETGNNLFTAVDKKNRIYRANPEARVLRQVPVMPSTHLAAVPSSTAGRPPAIAGQSYEQIHRDLALQYSPPIVLVDDVGDVLYLSRQAGQYLRISGGKASLNLPSLVAPELRFELRSAMSQALRTGEEVRTPAIAAGSGRVQMVVRLVEPTNAGRLLMVLFEPRPEEALPRGETLERDQVVLGYEQEIARLRDQLQATVEDSETSHEELKAANEELQAINEELRSTTEELETSKEELQSMNEELSTVNAELKSKLEEMAKVTDDLQNFIASTDVATVFVDRAMSIKRYTPQAAKLFNLIPTDVGRSLLDITHRLSYEGLADDAAKAFQALAVIEREVSSREGRWYLARILPYRTMEDRIEGAVLTFVDVTTRRSAQESARLIADQTKDYAMITIDVAGRIQMWNNGAERLYGYVASEVLGHKFDLLFTTEDQAAGVPTRELVIAEREGRFEDDRWHQRKDGSRFFSSGITMSVLENGALRGFAKIARDFTGQQRAMAERERRLQEEASRRAEAQAASETKDQFLAVLSHELKGPLNLIMLKAQMLARSAESKGFPGVAEDAQTIYRTGLAQAQLIDDLFDLARMSTGKLALALGPVDLQQQVGTFLDLAREESGKRGLELAIEAPAEPIVVKADIVRLQQIVWNLVNNAIKFTPSGGSVTIRLGEDAGFARFEITDTGRGIDPTMLGEVFNMFKQAPGVVERRSGLGIGLALVKQLSEAMGGRVDAASEGPGRGATFVVWLPLWRAEGATSASLTHEGRHWAGKRVVVLDRDADSASVLLELLTSEGMTVDVAHSAAEAREACVSRAVDVVIADLATSGGEAYALLRELHREATLRGVPVIAITDRLGSGIDAQLLQAGFRGYVGKPVSLEQLLEQVSVACAKEGER